MTDSDKFIVDPMTALYAAVTAVENGSVAEIELMFTNESDETHVAMSLCITVRKEAHKCGVLLPYNPKEE